ncbi:hypothetical protein DMH15_29525 [Streptomyces sp. WAC 06725]|uniref:hypothetical protein n=1 Tax=Streptomyces sp. WAC 06725 TaxID=2203209 RepID=UPI000F73E7BF|nr:hypothetical protein [Streptomyces sp. WAC 06725]RSO26415.1 hypothetical protein DMH15_29525 [Streptomyces sp. WAC 06725]
MPGTLTSPRPAETGTRPPRFTVRPATQADTEAMTALIDTSRAQQRHTGAVVPRGVAPAMALLGETDDYGHPLAWVIFEGAQLRAFFTMQVIPPLGEGQPRVWASGVCLDPEAPRGLRHGDLPDPTLPLADELARDGTPHAAVVLMFWLMHYTHEARSVRRVHLTLDIGTVDLHPQPVTWVPATVDTQVPEQYRLRTCLACHGAFGTPTDLPRAD